MKKEAVSYFPLFAQQRLVTKNKANDFHLLL